MSPETTLEVEVEDQAWSDALPNCVEIVERAATAVLGAPPPGELAANGTEGVAPPRDIGRNADRACGAHEADVGAAPSVASRQLAQRGSICDGIAITVLLTDDAAVQQLNADFRGKDASTNVLSFPAAESARPHLGDIALAYGVCAREAEAQGKPLAHHLMHLTVHGVLHLLGYDHESDAEAEAMEGIERAILSELGVPDPYAHPGHGVTEANA